MAMHTPTPWSHGFHDGTGCADEHQGGWILAGEHAAIEHPIVIVQGGQDEWGVAKGVVKPEDAAFIVKACNLFADLVLQLHAAEAFISVYEDKLPPDAQVLTRIRALLAKADAP